jgi:dolichyl-phosphate beta-glucosyltransferase
VPRPQSLSIVIPVLNEENEIARILTAAVALLEERDGEWEIIIVDNASTDQTAARAEPFVDGIRVRFLPNDVNRGKGYSIRRGMLEASSDLRLMCDADSVASLPSLAHMEDVAQTVDIVVGSRLSKGARVSRQQSLRRRFVGVGFIALTHLAMGRLPRDVFCGFKLWRGDVAQAVFERVKLDGWVFDAEALAMARRMGYSIEETGIEWENRPDSRLSIRHVLLPVVGELMQARRNVGRTPRNHPVAVEKVRSTNQP